METGTRVLLKRLRTVMAEVSDAQEKLDKIVEQIAANMVADVCSVYVLRDDENLELYATKGLNPDAVHNVSLKIGKGLVGTIAAGARPLNLQDAQKHPSFELLESTGEKPFNAFMGVPILRTGRVMGVLVIQNRKKRVYQDEEVEAAQTIAMILAELIAAGELVHMGNGNGGAMVVRPGSISGTGFAQGVGIGKVYLHAPRIRFSHRFSEDSNHELGRLWDGLGKLRLSIDDMLARSDVNKVDETREVLETYRMFANDRGWVRRIERAIRSGLSAEASVEKVQGDYQTKMQRIADPFIRDRLNDFDDLAYRLLSQLVGKENSAPDELPMDRAIIVARNMGAAELLNYDREKLAGLVLEDGGATSHVVIVAKALDIPVVGQAAGIISAVATGDGIIMDGSEGDLYLRPGEDIQATFLDKTNFQKARQRQYEKLRGVDATSVDGIKIDLLMNAGLRIDLPQLSLSGADGIGLFRTELQFMVSATLPRSGQQEALYRLVLDKAEDKPVTFRTLDIGGDKVLPYLRSEHEENPALGWRALRLTLDRPGLLKAQIRALLKAAAGRELRVMLPMVSEVREIRLAREIISHEMQLLERFGYELASKFKLGAMIEVPSVLYQLDEFMNEVDFASVGSNDLFQFMMASDRNNSRTASRFDPVSRPFVRALARIVKYAEKYDKELTLCGEFAGRPLGAMVLAAIGFRSISMSAASIGPVKSMIRHLDITKLQDVLLPAINEIDGGQTLRELLEDFVDANRILY